jgi:hypothetical protein
MFSILLWAIPTFKRGRLLVLISGWMSSKCPVALVARSETLFWEKRFWGEIKDGKINGGISSHES